MLSIVKSCGLQGIDGYIVEVETDVANGFVDLKKYDILPRMLSVNSLLSFTSFVEKMRIVW